MGEDEPVLPLSERLDAHLRTWLGAWPPAGPLTITTAPGRTSPGWDGKVREFVGVSCPEGAVFSVPPRLVSAFEGLAADLEGLRSADVGAVVGSASARYYEGVFRWSESPSVLEDGGSWVPVDDPRVPSWLKPFGREVLLSFDPATGEYVAGVGVKVHDGFGHELAVVTEEAARGRGLARRLVAQAARKVIADGAVPTYLHADDNVRSAKVADAAGFPDRGWRVLGIGS